MSNGRDLAKAETPGGGKQARCRAYLFLVALAEYGTRQEITEGRSGQPGHDAAFFDSLRADQVIVRRSPLRNNQQRQESIEEVVKTAAAFHPDLRGQLSARLRAAR